MQIWHDTIAVPHRMDEDTVRRLRECSAECSADKDGRDGSEQMLAWLLLAACLFGLAAVIVLAVIRAF